MKLLSDELKAKIETACHTAGEPDWDGENWVDMHWKQLAEYIIREVEKE